MIVENMYVGNNYKMSLYENRVYISYDTIFGNSLTVFDIDGIKGFSFCSTNNPFANVSNCTNIVSIPKHVAIIASPYDALPNNPIDVLHVTHMVNFMISQSDVSKNYSNEEISLSKDKFTEIGRSLKNIIPHVCNRHLVDFDHRMRESFYIKEAPCNVFYNDINSAEVRNILSALDDYTNSLFVDNAIDHNHRSIINSVVSNVFRHISTMPKYSLSDPSIISVNRLELFFQKVADKIVDNSYSDLSELIKPFKDSHIFHFRHNRSNLIFSLPHLMSVFLQALNFKPTAVGSVSKFIKMLSDDIIYDMKRFEAALESEAPF